jgi:hypothetical protein
MAAAMALPGIGATGALAQGYPDQPFFAHKELHYSDAQSTPRMRLRSPITYAYLPIRDLMAVEATSSREVLSGASPLFHNTLSGASGLKISEGRNTSDIKVIGFLPRGSVAGQIAQSREHDFQSNASTVEFRGSTEDNNTTLTLSTSDQHDGVTATGFPLIQGKRTSHSYLAGVTQVLSPVSITQTNLTYTRAYGYLSDPYKILDARPGSRHQFAWLTRYNRFFPASESALHLDYRFYRDSWRVEAHTLDAKYYMTPGSGWTVRPRMRYYTQKQAYFYRDVFPPPVGGGAFYTADQRLGAFGAISYGVMVAKELSHGISLDVRAERYQQRTKWRLFGSGSAVQEPLFGNILSFGISLKI